MTTSELFDRGFQHHRAGRLEEAEALYRQILAAEPEHAEAMHLLGLIADITGRGATAIELIEGAIRLRPGVSTYHSNLGEACRRLGQAEQAIAHYRRAIELKPDYAIAHFNLANVLGAEGRRNEALVAYRAAIRCQPGFADAHYNFGNVLRDAGRFSEALDQYERAVRARPDFAPALNNLGSALADLRGDTAGALTALRAAVKIDPTFANAHLNLGNVLRESGQIAEAIAEYEAALSLEPHSAGTRNNLGVALQERGDPGAAVQVLREALAVEPENAVLLTSLGNSLSGLGRLEEAASAYETALRHDPPQIEARYNLGLALKAQGRFAEAAEALLAAVTLQPGDPLARLNYSFALLVSGELKQGWPLYEARFDAGKHTPARRHMHLTRWLGQPADSVLIHAEQGFGDSIQFVRYAPLLAAQGTRVVVEVQAPLVELLRTIEGIEVIAEGSPFSPCQFQTPMLSLPLAFGTELATIPASASYLVADPSRRAKWRERLRGQLRVGLAWAGSPIHMRDRQRSMSLEQLAPLLAAPNVEWHSLQLGPAAAQLTNFPRIIDHARELTDFAETAALVAELDLVIAVDTAVVHLAGALGRPVWTMVALSPDWRWLLGRDDSPWYPSMRLFRQTTAGDWQPVIRAVREQLSLLAKSKS